MIPERDTPDPTGWDIPWLAVGAGLVLWFGAFALAWWAFAC